MNNNVADRKIADLRGVDLASLLTDDVDIRTRTALDRILEFQNSVCNSFNNFIS